MGRFLFSAAALAVCWLVAAAGSPGASPGLDHRPVVWVEFQVLSASGPSEPLNLRVDPENGGTGELRFQWPRVGSGCTVTVRATDRSGNSGGPVRRIQLLLTADADGRPASFTRKTWEIRDGATRVVELDRSGATPLTLGAAFSVEEEPFIPAVRTVGPAVRYHVHIERWISGRAIPLETNVLDTFVGESVRYAFDLENDVDTSALEIELRPSSIAEKVLVTEVTLSGRLMEDAGPRLISRRERVVSSSRVTSRIQAQPADPPDGYVFLVTPEF